MPVQGNLPSSSSNSSCPDIHLELFGMKAGIIRATAESETDTAAGLTWEFDRACEYVRGQYSFDSLRHWPPVTTVRKMFSAWGSDPSKYRPSSEALLRRVIKGKSIPRISNMVDIANIGAIETGWPYGCYDCEKISGAVRFRRGKAGEQYEGIGRPLFRLEGRPVFSDSYGPFGSPVSDSRRTMVTRSSRELLFIICAPESTGDSALQGAVAKVIERLARWCSVGEVKSKIVGPAPEPSFHSQRTFPDQIEYRE